MTTRCVDIFDAISKLLRRCLLWCSVFQCVEKLEWNHDFWECNVNSIIIAKKMQKSKSVRKRFIYHFFDKKFVLLVSLIEQMMLCSKEINRKSRLYTGRIDMVIGFISALCCFEKYIPIAIWAKTVLNFIFSTSLTLLSFRFSFLAGNLMGNTFTLTTMILDFRKPKI